MTIDSIKIVRTAMQIIAGIGVSKVVSDVVRNNTSVVTKYDQVRVLIGGTVISTIAADITKRHVDNKIDTALALFNDRKNASEEEDSEEETPEGEAKTK